MYEAITFSRRWEQNQLRHHYQLDGEPLKRVNVVKDLGVLLDRKMTFIPHLNKVVARGKCMLGFMKRQSKEFDCPQVTKLLFCALVRPLLEYCSVVWSPTLNCDSKRIESIQKQFLLFALRGLGWSHRFRLPPYEARLSLLGLESLSDRGELAEFLWHPA